MPSNKIVHVPFPTASSGAQTSGMTRASALSAVSPLLNASVMTAAPYSESAIQHHGAQDAIIYALRGSGGAVVTDKGATVTKMAPGDFCLIPGGVEHLESNTGGEEVVWVIVRSGSEAEVVNLDGWSE